PRGAGESILSRTFVNFEGLAMTRLSALRLLVAFSIVVVFSGVAMVASQRSASNMATAANAWLGSLSAEQSAKATFPFESEERLRWHFIPTAGTGIGAGHPRFGLRIKDMNEQQRQLAHALLKTGLSQKGYATTTSIVDLE